MRAAVSSILSDMSEPSPLAFPDYDQLASDHRRLLVLIHPLGEAIEPEALQRFWSVATRRVSFPIEDEALTQVPLRPLEVRFLQKYPVENNEWSEFQAHRAVYGLIGVGVTRNPDETAELARLQEATKTQYSKTLIASRLILLHDEPVATVNGDAPEAESNNNKAHDSLDYAREFSEERLERDIQSMIHDHIGKIHLICAPFERRDFVGLDMDSRVNKRRMNGRFKKHVGDLSLLCGMLKEAQEFYSIATEVLKGCSDWLWMANSLEGLCSVSVVVNYPHAHRPKSLRSSSLESAKSKRAPLAKSPAKSNSLGDGRQLRNHLALTAQDLLEAYREIVVHYSKYRHAGVIETEASIKAVQVLTHQQSFLAAAEFLQNVVFINLQMNDDEKVHRFSALSKLYEQIHFKRKAAFFNRVAAMRCVAPQNPRPNWKQCYQLLFQTLQGYSIKFISESSQRAGWSDLQVQILQELVGTARRMGDPVAATRHMAYIIEQYSRHISQDELADLLHQLSVLTAKSPPGSVPTGGDTDTQYLPPVDIYSVPIVQSFRPAPQPDSLIPHAPAKTPSEQKGPFIFTTIQSKSESPENSPIHCVQGEIFDVELELLNPLKTSLDVMSMSLLHEGAKFEAFEVNFTLPECPANRAPVKIRLSGIPHEEGEVKIYGYSVMICGVKSSCVWKTSGKQASFRIKVCPPIPRLDIHIRGYENKEEVALSILKGETKELSLGIENNGNMTVGEMDVQHSVAPTKYSECVTREPCQMTLAPGCKTEATLKIQGRGSPTVFSFTVNVSVKYSNDSLSHHRKKVIKICVQLLASVNIAWWDILPGETAKESYIVLDLQNDSPEEMDVSYDQRKRIAIDSDSRCRIPLPMAKVQFDDASGLSRSAFFEQYLREQLDLMWTLTAAAEPISGVVDATVISLSPEMASRLELSPLSWQVSLGGHVWEGGDLSFASGLPLPIEICVTNKAGYAIRCRFLVTCQYVSETGGAVMESIAVSGKRNSVACAASECKSFRFLIIPGAPGRAVLKCHCIVESEEQASSEMPLPSIHMLLT